MGFSLGALLPVLGSLAGNALLPGVGGVIGGQLGAAFAGKKGTQKAVDETRALDSKNYGKYLQAASPNQVNAAGATNAWTVDPETGARSQKVSFGPEEQKRRDMYNQMMGNRMTQAGAMDMSRYNKGMDFSENPRLAQYQKQAGGMRQPNAPTTPYQLTPRPAAPAAGVNPSNVDAQIPPSVGANPSNIDLQSLTPEEIQRLLTMLRSGGYNREAGGGDGNVGGGDGGSDGGSDGGGGPAGTW